MRKRMPFRATYHPNIPRLTPKVGRARVHACQYPTRGTRYQSAEGPPLISYNRPPHPHIPRLTPNVGRARVHACQYPTRGTRYRSAEGSPLRTYNVSPTYKFPPWALHVPCLHPKILSTPKNVQIKTRTHKPNLFRQQNSWPNSLGQTHIIEIVD